MGQGARVHEEVEQALRGENTASLDGRSIQPYLTYKLARLLDTELTLARSEGVIEISAG
jgi:histidine phosphotransferase ChpT